MRVSGETRLLASYLAGQHEHDLPSAVVDRTILHIVDTLAAVISGSALPPGRRGAAYVRGLGGAPEATVLGAGFRSNPENAVLANGMAAHADETDDSHAPSLSHPGCAVVPAALAVAEQRHSSGMDLVRSVAAGYDAGTRFVLALGRPELRTDTSGRSTHALAGLFGSAAAASVLHRLDETAVRHALSYAAQSASGVTSWVRDGNHVEKAFVFGGMPAANGVRAAAIVASGCDGVDDPFWPHPNVIDAFSSGPARHELVDGLGERYEITRTNIKKFAVGSPAQAAVQAVLDLIATHDVSAGDVEDIEIILPHDLAGVVDGRSMPDINVQYLVAGTLLDRRFTFAMAHDADRMKAPEVAALVARTRLKADEKVSVVRSATVTLHTTDGRELRRHVASVRGTAEDPMSESEVTDKALDLVVPVLGRARAEALLTRLLSLADVDDVTALRALLTAPT